MLKKNACLEKENRHGSNILFCFKKLGASKEEKKEGTSILTIFAPHLQTMRGPLNKI